jgi:hypothetical protein
MGTFTFSDIQTLEKRLHKNSRPTLKSEAFEREQRQK